MEQPLPEIHHRVAIGLLDAREKIAEQHAEEHESEQLGIRSRLHDVGRHDVEQSVEHAGRRAIFHRVSHLACVRLKRQKVAGGLACHDSGLHDVDDGERDQHRDQRGEDVERQRLQPEPPELAPGAERGNARHDRRRDERHDQHLQQIDEERAEEFEPPHRIERPELPVRPDEPAQHRPRHHGDENRRYRRRARLGRAPALHAFGHAALLRFTRRPWDSC